MTDERPQDRAELRSASEQETQAVGARMAGWLRAGDTVLLSGSLGAGKTTLVRGLLAALGFAGPVRSPTFNLIQTFETNPPVVHADLYRVASSEGLGLEDALEDYLVLVEWPDRFVELPHETCWRVAIEGAGHERTITMQPPAGSLLGFERD